MRSFVLAGLLLASAMTLPLASADPIVDDVWFCAIEVGTPVIRACVETWDHPQEICVVVRVGVRVIDPCVNNPDDPFEP